jgi:hypothetical protein
VTRRTVRRVVVAFVLLVVAALVAGKLALAPWVRGKIQYALANRYGLDLTVESVSLDVFGGSATLTGIRVRDGDRIVLDAAEARGTIGVRDVLDGRYDFGKLVLVRPVLHIAAEPSGGTDLAKIFARPPRTPPSRPAAPTSPRSPRGRRGRRRRPARPTSSCSATFASRTDAWFSWTR